MVNQICIAGVVQGLAEGLHFARRAGLDPQAVCEALSKGAAQSWQMDNRWASMSDGKFDFGFAVDWMRKDLGLVLDEAGRNGARVPVTALVDKFYGDVQHMGGNRRDTSSLIMRLKNRQGPTYTDACRNRPLPGSHLPTRPTTMSPETRQEGE